MVIPTSGILAGCFQGTDLARAILYGIVEHLHLRYRPRTLGQVVDDIAIGHASKDPRHAVNVITDVVECFVLRSRAKRLVFAVGTPAIVGSTMGLARAVVAKLRARGIDEFVAEPFTRDIGLDFGGGRRRAVGVARARLLKSKRRLEVISGLGWRARKLAPVGRYPLAAGGRKP